MLPSQLLCGRCITTLPYPRDSAENSMCESRTKHADAIHTGNNKQEIKVGEVIQIHNDTYRNQWKLGIINKLFTGKDNCVHSSQLKTAQGYTNRPIAKLYSLEITATEATSAKGRLSRATKEAAINKNSQMDIVNIELIFVKTDDSMVQCNLIPFYGL